MKNVERLCPACGQVKSFRADCKTCGCKGTNPSLVTKAEEPKADTFEEALDKVRERKSGKDTEIKRLRERVVELQSELDTAVKVFGVTPQEITIDPDLPSGKSESVAVALCSDHHSEEEVLPGQVGGVNEYNLQIYDRRFSQWLNGLLSWLSIEQQKTHISLLVLALLGDYISGSIHDELMESNLLLPADAILNARAHLIAGIKFLLEKTPPTLKLLIVCHSGNHGRMTKKQRISTEAGNSLEHFMYCTLAETFANEPRVTFQIATGYHTFVNLFDGAFPIRFHHGHQINYQGGVGGITIPVNKAIAQWNKQRTVKLDCFGHFHTRLDGGNFVCNGSMIGYNAYAVSIKASYERPSQTMFLVNKKWCEKTMVAPIFME